MEYNNFVEFLDFKQSLKHGKVIAKSIDCNVCDSMQKPNLDRLWQVWIKIGIPQGSHQDWFNRVVSLVKSQVTEVISILEKGKVMDWYYFLIHGRENDSNCYFHIVFSLREGVESKDFLNSLPSYCLDLKHLERGYGESISGIEKTLLKDDEIEEAWRIIGRQSEWIIDVVNIHKDREIPIQQFMQFMHFYMNAIGLGRTAKLTIPPFLSF